MMIICSIFLLCRACLVLFWPKKAFFEIFFSGLGEPPPPVPVDSKWQLTKLPAPISHCQILPYLQVDLCQTELHIKKITKIATYKAPQKATQHM